VRPSLYQPNAPVSSFDQGMGEHPKPLKVLKFVTKLATIKCRRAGKLTAVY